MNWFNRKAEQPKSKVVVRAEAPTLPDRAERVTVKTALTESAVYRSVGILSTSVSQMELGVFKANTEVPETDRGYPTWLQAPEYGQSLYSFLSRTTTSLALTGNAFWRVSRNAAGTVVNVEVLNPLAMSVQRNSGVVEYHYTGYDKPRVFSEKEVKHLTTLLAPGQLTGLGVLESGDATLATMQKVRAFADNYFSKAGVPSVVLEISADLTPEELKKAKEDYAATTESGGVAATDKNTTVKVVGANPQEAMAIDYQQFLITDIARRFGIPARLLLAAVDGTSDTYSNLTTDNRLFVIFTLRAYLSPIEDALSALLPRGTKAKFKTEELLREDTKTRYEAYAIGLERGFLTVAEVRSLEGMPSLGGTNEANTDSSSDSN